MRSRSGGSSPTRLGALVPVSGLYLAVMQSALCLGPTVGRLTANELLGREAVE